MDEQKTREAAYRLWEKQGKPQGQDLEHWFTAERSVGEEESGNSTSESTPSRESEGSSLMVQESKKKKYANNRNQS